MSYIKDPEGALWVNSEPLTSEEEVMVHEHIARAKTPNDNTPSRDIEKK